MLAQGSADKPDLGGSAGLLILTGASHTGKTSVARSILDLKGPPGALLGVDQMLDHTLVRPPGERWNEIPLAYKLLRAQTQELLRAGWFVVLESTFTFVPTSGAPEFHGEEIERFVGIALTAGAPFLVAQLRASEATLIERAKQTGRLSFAIVTQTRSLHEGVEIPDRAITADTSKRDVEQLARDLLVRFTAA